MGNNKIGGTKSRDKNLARDPDFYRKIGRIGGSKKTDKPKGFAADHERARIAGARGGRKSSRKGIKNRKKETV